MSVNCQLVTWAFLCILVIIVGMVLEDKLDRIIFLIEQPWKHGQNGDAENQAK